MKPTPHDRVLEQLVALAFFAQRRGLRGVARQIAGLIFDEKRRVCGVPR